MAIHTEVLGVTDDHVARARRYPMAIAMEDGDWVARVVGPDFPFVIGAAETPEAAAAELISALATVIAGFERDGDAVPEPAEAYSGHLNARLPKSLHRALAQRAAAEGMSVNATLTYLLTQALTAEAPALPGSKTTSTARTA
jgi:antitoxin HicB